MSKPTVYVDTNIVSFLFYRGADLQVLKRQRATREWWKDERPLFKLLASRAVESELADGVYPGQEKALAEVRKMAYLAYSSAVRDVEAKLLAAHVVPLNVPGDALQRRSPRCIV